MKCPLCGKPVTEPGACLACLPFNMYFGFERTPDIMEACRLLTIKHQAKLEKIPFSQAKIKGGKLPDAIEGDAEVQTVTDGDMLIIPALDGSARKSVFFVRKPS